MVVGSSPTLDVSFSAFSQASSDDALPTPMSSWIVHAYTHRWSSSSLTHKCIIIVMEDEVLVCEFQNEGIIMVYDRDLNYKRFIERNGSVFIETVYVHGNIYEY